MAPKPRSEAERATERTPAWAEQLVRLLDDGLTIPGTRIGIGLDALLGFLFPTLGDALTGLGSLSLLRARLSNAAAQGRSCCASCSTSRSMS